MKRITPTTSDLKKILLNVKQQLETRHYEPKITIDLNSINPLTNIQKPTVRFTEDAYKKMMYLVNKTENEIGFHGTVEKDGNIYTITDILVYPQTVTSVTVTTDETKLCAWQLKIPTETFNKIRMQGHSHVNMAATPSATDHMTYKNILQILQKDDFYIFLIVNKRETIWVQLYDLKQNVIFENRDVTIVKEINDDLEQWFKEQTTQITTHTIKDYRNPRTSICYDKLCYCEMVDEQLGTCTNKVCINPNVQNLK